MVKLRLAAWAGLGGSRGERIVLGDAAGEDLGGGPFAAAIVGAVEGGQKLASDAETAI